MKTPEEIKRGMEHCAEIGCKGCPYEEDCKMFDGFSIPAEDAYFYIQQLEQDNARKDERIRQLEQRVPRWISVEERMPESGVHVLVTAKTPGGHKYVCDAFHAEKFSISSEYGDELACEYNPEKDEYFLEEGWYEVIKNWDDYSSIVIQDQVTHWMPFPEPPEEDA